MSYKSVKKLKPFELVLQKELMDLDEIEGIELNQINENNLEEISVSITPREGYFINKTIKFVLKFKDTYPITPPKIVCITKIFHPNVDENGNVCLNVLKLDWTPAISLQMLILGLLILLTEPTTEDPFNIVAAEVLQNDKRKFIEINNDLYKRK
ncbi:NEDD8-conjugating enzyme UBC12, putative [Hepatocystis sp. ex Piliocolobus tephrosceles]|uniref:NEDD8-conjugating enzyme UBC12-like n=1 Tax=Piliocolobus tephrosceles TaxID=591936 RepID=A0A8C9LRL9_9PRIM|nr:NEDD8-conjugating enzyme UBC12, putative [Hepatocystis sp. ex Piliocolobus tephrosceles]